MLDKIEATVLQLKQTKPMVLCLTNQVTIDFMANCLLALGAAPIMSCDESELEELIALSQAVNINIGTLEPEFIQRCTVAVNLAKQSAKPIILDPVGAGASLIRTKSAQQLMSFADIIRGNASEVITLSAAETTESTRIAGQASIPASIKTFAKTSTGVLKIEPTSVIETKSVAATAKKYTTANKSQTRGVESVHQTGDAKFSAHTLAESLNCTVVVSGAEDFITDGKQQHSLLFGSPLMPLVTGMGCALTAVIAAFRAVIEDPFAAATMATAYFSLCGSLCHGETDKPGTFRTIFIDELYSANFLAMSKLCAR